MPTDVDDEVLAIGYPLETARANAFGRITEGGYAQAVVLLAGEALGIASSHRDDVEFGVAHSPRVVKVDITQVSHSLSVGRHAHRADRAFRESCELLCLAFEWHQHEVVVGLLKEKVLGLVVGHN